MDAAAEIGSNPASKHHIQSEYVWRMSRLARDGTAEPVSRDQNLRHVRGQVNFNFGETTQQGAPWSFCDTTGYSFYPAGMRAPDWSTLVFTLPRRKIAWVHPTKATFFQNCTLIWDKYPVVAENETLPPAISPAEITLRSRQRAPKYISSPAKHTVRNRHQGPASSSSA